MKSFLLLILLIPKVVSAQESERLYVDFIQDRDSFPDCKTIFFTNGYYTKPKLELIPFDFPNITPVHPTELTFDRYLNFYSFGVEAEKYGSAEFDQTRIVSYSHNEVIELIYTTPDSSRAQWLVNNDNYLWEKFQILHDAKPIEKMAKLSEDVTIKVEEEPSPPYGPVNVTSGIIDGVFIPEGGFIRLEPYNYSHFSDELRAEKKHVQQKVQPLLDSLLQPFYFSNYELTIGEYRDFINWVFDSIELQMAYQNLPYNDAKLLLDCPKRIIKTLDSTQRQQQALEYGLVPTRKSRIDDLKWWHATLDLYYPLVQRYYKRIEIDTRKLSYHQNDSVSIAIYPDTLGFNREELGIVINLIGDMSWHPTYRNYPIVNLTKEQILAYCHWKQRQLNTQFKDEGLKITVRPPYIREYEFATKLAVGENSSYLAHVEPNTHFTPFQREVFGNEFSFYQAVNFHPTGIGRKKKQIMASLEYQMWYQANDIPNSPFRFLNGNVSEFALDTVSAETWKYYGMGQDQPKKSANYVLGTNYFEDAKPNADDQYNTAMYKTVLLEGESSPCVGVRLVYLVEKISTN